MVGAPVSYSGNQPLPQPHPIAGTHPTMNPETAAAKYAPPPPHKYSTPNAPISALLPYDGRTPPSAPAAPYAAPAAAYMDPPTSSAPFNTNYLYAPPYPAVTSAAAQPPPYPPCSAALPPPFPPCSTAPYPPPSNPSTPLGIYHPASSSAPPPAAYPPASSAPPPFTGVYPPNLQAPAYYSPQQPPSYNPQAPSGYPAGNHNHSSLQRIKFFLNTISWWHYQYIFLSFIMLIIVMRYIKFVH